LRARRIAANWAPAASDAVEDARAFVVGPALAEGGRAAKQLFGNIAAPADLTPRPIGGYTRGCLAGAVALPPDGPNWQVMRLSRNRNWGHPILVEYLKKFSADMASDSRSGLLVGDLSQPRGGPMLSGHASHQSGLDADIWFLPMPDYTMSAEEREKRSAVSLLMTGRLSVDPRKWSDLYPRLLKRAVSYPEVARIFVSAAIKQKLCETAGSDRAWLRREPGASFCTHAAAAAASASAQPRTTDVTA